MNRLASAGGILLIFALSFAFSTPLLKAGTVATLASSPEYSGKLTLNTASIHVDGASPADINLPDILEADFTDLPFQLDFFSTTADGGGNFPATWKPLEIGQVLTPGTATYAKGAISLSSEGVDPKTGQDRYFFVGQPWTGNGSGPSVSSREMIKRH
jgi:hypothetical protein